MPRGHGLRVAIDRRNRSDPQTNGSRPTLAFLALDVCDLRHNNVTNVLKLDVHSAEANA